MTLYAILFYAIAILMVFSTAMAVTRKHLVHAVLYLVLSFFGSAMLFYLLGAPFLAALEIIIYAGAIMVLFLFAIMMVQIHKDAGMFFPKQQLLPAMGICIVFLAACGAILHAVPSGQVLLAAGAIDPKALGHHVFATHWLAVEVTSLLLLVALVGAFLLGRQGRRLEDVEKETP